MLESVDHLHWRMTWMVEGVDHPCWKRTRQNNQKTCEGDNTERWVNDRKAAHDGQKIANKEKTMKGVGHLNKEVEKYSQHATGSTDHLRDKWLVHEDEIKGIRDWGR